MIQLNENNKQSSCAFETTADKTNMKDRLFHFLKAMSCLFIMYVLTFVATQRKVLEKGRGGIFGAVYYGLPVQTT